AQGAERVVELHNDSGESLDVRLRYRTKLDGRWTWRNARFTLAPGQRQQPLDGQGMRIRAARMNLRGETPNRRYQRHADEPLWLVDEAAGRRLYAADRIGKFIYIFTPRGEGAETSMARITAASATVMDGSRQVATVRRGDSLEVVSTRPGWSGVRVDVGGTPQTGWIRDSDAEVTVTGPAADPGDPVRRTLVVTAAAAAVKVGPETIATLPRGAQSPVYEERDGWYRVEVQVEGSARHGWVQRGQVQVQ
ncbi:MAG TPA: hypothetical protein PJ982_02455, partial [Lacipirellulaceae bacterium]|nr:hypothetical protein [Lacipirellulaceae bacterium]